MRERLRQAVDKNNALEAELEETREKVKSFLTIHCAFLHFRGSHFFHSLISFCFIFLQLKELEQENEEIRLRNLRRVRTEEKLHASSENCQENGDENSNDEKVSSQSKVCSYNNFLSWFGLVEVLHAHTVKVTFYWLIDFFAEIIMPSFINYKF